MSSSPVWIALAISAVVVVASGVVTYQRGGAYGERFSPVEQHIRRFTEPRTGRLRVIAFDRNGNGRMDSWTYFDDEERMLRTEADDDENGVIDHWFEYDPQGSMTRMGTSSRDDGVVDTWWYEGLESGGRRVEYYDRQSHAIVRTEFYDKEGLVRIDHREASLRR